MARRRRPWPFRRSPVMLPIPGTGDPEHLADNMKRAGLGLDEAELDALDRRSRQAWDAARTT